MKGVIKGDTFHISISERSARKLTTEIICTSVDRSTPFYVCIFVKESDILQASGAANSMKKLIA